MTYTMRRKLAVGLCCVCAAVLASPVCAAQAAEAWPEPGAARPAPEENCIDGWLSFWDGLMGKKTGFVTVDGQVHYCSQPGVYDQFTPGFVTVEGKLYHVEPDGVTFTQVPAGFSVVGSSLCYSSDGQSIDTFQPGFVTIEGGLYHVLPDGYSFECHPAGTYIYGSELYCVPADGAQFLTGGVWKGLEFGPDGRYTSGNAQLDGYVKQVLAQCTNDSMSQEQRLRAAYLYVRDHGRYLARSHRPRGSVDWAMEEALFFFENNRGNCYGFAGAFLYLARQLGYEAYPVSGGVGYDNKDHAWVIIPWADGQTYLFDVELEYAYRYRYANKRDLDLFKMTAASAPFVYTFPQ